MDKIYYKAQSIQNNIKDIQTKMEGKGGIKKPSEDMKKLGAKT